MTRRATGAAPQPPRLSVPGHERKYEHSDSNRETLTHSARSMLPDRRALIVPILDIHT